jgi:hypothetical protein
MRAVAGERRDENFQINLREFVLLLLRASPIADQDRTGQYPNHGAMKEKD